MPDHDKVIAVYSRKSRFTGKGESIGNQVELCREYIRSHYGEGADQDAEVYEDEGFSGGNLNRPGFKAMMKAARERRFRAIIVYRLDRISRNISDFSGLIEELSRLDIAFVSIREQFDTGTPMGRAMMYIASVFSQLERETIAERIRDNMHELAKTGRWLGGVTPTGYASESVKSVTVEGKARKTCRLKLIPEEAEVVRCVYRLFMETNSLTLTEAELMRRQVVTKNGRYFTRFSIKAILENPVYLIADPDAYGYFADREAELFSGSREFDGEHGILAYNRTRQEKGRATVYLPVKEWIVAVGQHPGLIPGRDWVEVQKKLQENKSKSFRRPRSNEALLTGILYCGCGSRMYPKVSGRRTKDGRQAFAYVCKMKEHSRRSICNGRNVNGNQLDQAVLECVGRLEGDPAVFAGRMGQTRKAYVSSRAQNEEYEGQAIAMRQKKAEAERKINALVDSLAEVGNSSARMHITGRIEQLHAEAESIGKRLQKLEEKAFGSVLNSQELDGIKQFLPVFGKCLEKADAVRKREAVRRIVRKVVWDGENAHVALLGEERRGEM
ncbi:recombinase family protein [Clostridiaceae bacterium]|nr:recombinase family protein [Clostridiaceae bacterium]RKI18426.1 recombinase family protein [bacterium 1XD21-70]